MKDGYRSIYLDCYHDSRRSYEYLKLHLVPETDEEAVRQNAATMRKAEAILRKRSRELKKLPTTSKRLTETQDSVSKADITLQEWLARFKEIQKGRGIRDLYAIDRLRGIIADMGGGEVKLKSVDKDFCLSFMEYLKTGYRTASGQPLKSKTVFNRQCTLITALNVAVREGIIPFNPMNRLSRHERAKTNKGKREFLTIDEVKTLIDAPCRREDIKSAFLFSCYCGLRISDVLALKWKDVDCTGEQWHINIIMQKTQQPLYLPLSMQARKWLPERNGAGEEEAVFSTLPSEDTCNVQIKQWVKEAGITKHVTYHVSRHTFATMLLTLGADLYTVCKLLGHTDVKTTQIYAKIINKKKDDAIGLIDTEFAYT